MRITFGQYNQPYYQYGNQKSKNPNYKENNKDKIKNTALLTLGTTGLLLGVYKQLKGV